MKTAQRTAANSAHCYGVDIVLGQTNHRRHAAAVTMGWILEYLNAHDFTIIELGDGETAGAPEVL